MTSLTRPRTARMSGSLLVAIDQGVLSLSTVLVTILVARGMSVTDFGVFTLVITMVTLLVGLVRASIFEPLLIRAASSGEDSNKSLRHRIAGGVAFAIVIGAATGVVVAVVLTAVLSHGAAPSWLLVLTMCGPFLQDAMRMVLLIGDQRIWMLVIDAAILASQAILLILSTRSHKLTVPWSLFVWGAAALGWGAVAVIRTKSLSGLAKRYVWDVSPQGRAFGADYVLGILTSQLTLWVATFASGAAAAAALRGSDTLMGPLRVMLLAAPAMLLPRLSGLTSEPRPFRRTFWTGLVSSVTLAGAWYLAAVFALPHLGPRLLGRTWAQAAQVLPFIAGSYLFISATTLFTIGLKSLDCGRLLVSNRLILLPIGITSGIVGGAVWGALGAAMATISTSAVAASIWGIRFMAAGRKHWDNVAHAGERE